jgi:hypothetical protein
MTKGWTQILEANATDKVIATKVRKNYRCNKCNAEFNYIIVVEAVI